MTLSSRFLLTLHQLTDTHAHVHTHKQETTLYKLSSLYERHRRYTKSRWVWWFVNRKLWGTKASAQTEAHHHIWIPHRASWITSLRGRMRKEHNKRPRTKARGIWWRGVISRLSDLNTQTVRGQWTEALCVTANRWGGGGGAWGSPFSAPPQDSKENQSGVRLTSTQQRDSMMKVQPSKNKTRRKRRELGGTKKHSSSATRQRKHPKDFWSF